MPLSRDQHRLNAFLRDAAAISLEILAPDSLAPIIRAAGITRSNASRWRSQGAGPLGTLTIAAWHLARDRKAVATSLVTHFEGVIEQSLEEAHIAGDAVQDRFSPVIRSYFALKRQMLLFGFNPGPDTLRNVRKLTVELSASARQLSVLAAEMERRAALEEISAS